MAKATEAQVRKLEYAHKDLFYNLAFANKIWLEMAKKVYMLADTDPKKIAVINYGKKIVPIGAAWVARQRKLEKDGGVSIIPIYATSFFDMKELPKWTAEVNKIYGPNSFNSSLGIIPLIIWGVVAIIAAISAAFIVDETNTTAQEKESLMKETEKTCKDLNLNAADCAKMVSQTQAQTDTSGEGGLTTTLKWGMGLAALILLMNQLNKNKS